MKFLKDNLKRHEIKFILNQKEKINFINNSNLKILFPDRIVESVFFDTKDLRLFSLSEEGITPRIKIRIRGYDNGELNNLEIKTTRNYHREKIVLRDFKFDNFNLHNNLKKFGINKIVEKKIRVKYLRSYYELEGVGRITMDRNIEFLYPNRNSHNSKKIGQIILEVKIQSDKIDKNKIERIINLKESRFSKYCEGINIFNNIN